MENKNQNEKGINEAIRRIVRPIFERFAQEAKKNRMMVGGTVDTTNKCCLYQPHNYRLYFDFDRQTFSSQTVLNSTVQPLFPMELKIRNKTEYSIDNFFGCRITIKRRTAEVINKVDSKRWYRIPLGIEEIKPTIKRIIEKKDKESRESLRKFISMYGGKSNFIIIRRRSEDKIKAEDKIDLIPVKQHWHNDVVKKVYDESNVEFLDASFASNYLRTRAVEDKADSIMDVLKGMSNSLRFVAENYKSHAGLVKELYKLSKNLNKRITQTKLGEYL